ncbi:hypothetical protein BCR37DRAFT_378696 [Protomyces lactucae-debilis]|uniref:Uncharacterized protein n=1 Tax=Protomyces lactucae-debilis TaxID=2754530 RepID=A0A1Y2FKI1_PROLT|nr:uncharacterized protein BCR37DRAFT_378696 [Protomyces lactucae-debilis]ORY83726.1 hypothetical protein BCR37DRAFT_378696 [Protomyces lactucae-debilis]
MFKTELMPHLSLWMSLFGISAASNHAGLACVRTSFVDDGKCYALKFTLSKLVPLPEGIPCAVYCRSEANIFDVWYQAMKKLPNSRPFVCSTGWELIEWSSWTPDETFKGNPSSTDWPIEFQAQSTTPEESQLIKHKRGVEDHCTTRNPQQQLVRNKVVLMAGFTYHLILSMNSINTLRNAVFEQMRTLSGRFGYAPFVQDAESQSPTRPTESSSHELQPSEAGSGMCISPAEGTNTKSKSLARLKWTTCECLLSLEFDLLLLQGPPGTQPEDDAIINSVCAFEDFARDIAKLPRDWQLKERSIQSAFGSQGNGFDCSLEESVRQDSSDLCLVSEMLWQDSTWKLVSCTMSEKLRLAKLARAVETARAKFIRHFYPDPTDQCRNPRRARGLW